MVQGLEEGFGFEEEGRIRGVGRYLILFSGEKKLLIVSGIMFFKNLLVE